MSYKRRVSLENFVTQIGVLILGYILLILFVQRQTGITIATPAIPVWVLIFIVELFVIGVGYKIYHLYRLSKAGIYDIDKMTGTEFEEKLSILFSQLGYSVRHTGKTGDYGVDLIIEKDGKKTAVQALHTPGVWVSIVIQMRFEKQ